MFRRDGELVMVGLLKKEEFKGLNLRYTGIMWEVKNGIHMHQTRSAMSYLTTDETRVLDDLLCMQSIDMHGVKMTTHRFKDDGEFWKFVEEHHMQKAIVKSRLTPEMEQEITKQREAISKKAKDA